ncbi:MAG: hypothetical protein ABIO70_09225 [Pseudomonadota bacterium]
MIRLPRDHRFTADADPAVSALLRVDLAAVATRCEARAPRGTLLLGGSFALGEGVAFLVEGRVVVLSDLDLFLVSPGGPLRALALAARLRRDLMGAARARIDLTVLARGLARMGLQGVGDLPVVAGAARGGAGGFDPSFPLHALHALQEELLTPERDPLRRRYRINRCALAAVRALRALEEPSARGQRAALAWLEAGGGRGLPARARALLREAGAENLDLGLARGAGSEPGWPCWCAARDVLDALQARLGGGLGFADRLKACQRLAWTVARRGRAPRLVGGVHPRLVAVRSDLLHARGEAGELDGGLLARAWRHLAALGLLAGPPPGDPESAWHQAVAAARLDNPLRVVMGGEGPAAVCGR